MLSHQVDFEYSLHLHHNAIGLRSTRTAWRHMPQIPVWCTQFIVWAALERCDRWSWFDSSNYRRLQSLRRLMLNILHMCAKMQIALLVVSMKLSNCKLKSSISFKSSILPKPWSAIWLQNQLWDMPTRLVASAVEYGVDSAAQISWKVCHEVPH